MNDQQEFQSTQCPKVLDANTNGLSMSACYKESTDIPARPADVASGQAQAPGQGMSKAVSWSNIYQESANTRNCSNVTASTNTAAVSTLPPAKDSGTLRASPIVESTNIESPMPAALPPVVSASSMYFEMTTPSPASTLATTTIPALSAAPAAIMAPVSTPAPGIASVSGPVPTTDPAPVAAPVLPAVSGMPRIQTPTSASLRTSTCCDSAGVLPTQTSTLNPAVAQVQTVVPPETHSAGSIPMKIPMSLKNLEPMMLNSGFNNAATVSSPGTPSTLQPPDTLAENLKDGGQRANLMEAPQACVTNLKPETGKLSNAADVKLQMSSLSSAMGSSIEEGIEAKNAVGLARPQVYVARTPSRHNSQDLLMVPMIYNAAKSSQQQVSYPSSVPPSPERLAQDEILHGSKENQSILREPRRPSCTYMNSSINEPAVSTLPVVRFAGVKKVQFSNSGTSLPRVKSATPSDLNEVVSRNSSNSSLSGVYDERPEMIIHHQLMLPNPVIVRRTCAHKNHFMSLELFVFLVVILNLVFLSSVVYRTLYDELKPAQEHVVKWTATV